MIINNHSVSFSLWSNFTFLVVKKGKFSVLICLLSSATGAAAGVGVSASESVAVEEGNSRWGFYIKAANFALFCFTFLSWK